MKPFRILHLIYSTGVYGAEKHLLELLPALKNHNIVPELIFICSRQTVPHLEQYSEKLKTRGIPVQLLPVSSKISLMFAIKRVAKYLRNNNIPCVHSHLFSADLIAVLAKKFFFRQLTVFSTKHGYEEEYLVQYGMGNGRIRYNFYYRASKYILRYTDASAAVSKPLSEMYVRLGLTRKPMHVIQHGVNIQPTTNKGVILTGNPRILVVGRLSVIKGHTFLLQALPGIIEKFPELRVYFLGNGPLKVKLKAEADQLNLASHISFEGFADPADYARQCDLMVLPSLFESFGLVFIESFSWKIPVIAFDAEAGNQIIENGKTGVLVPKSDVKELRKEIIELLSNQEARQQLSARAYEKYKSYFTVERMADDTAAWYREVAGQE